jgi:hypothetical protein
MASGAEYEVKLALTTRAYLLMREEFPRAIPHLKHRPQDQDFPYTFEARLYGLEGVGRFVMGLPGQVKIIDPDELRKYIDGLYPGQEEILLKTELGRI